MKDLLESYSRQLILCPHCGADGAFVLANHQGVETVCTKCSGCGHTSVDRFPTKEGILRLLDEWAIGSPHPKITIPPNTPIILNYGGGVDSTALLVAMVNQGIRPDLIVMADPGGEKRETYQYVDFFEEWLVSKGFPGITRVTLDPPRSSYSTLEQNSLDNDTLPSISFGFSLKNCTLKWKAKAMDNFILGITRGPNKRAGWAPALESLAKGTNPVKLIGYDDGKADSRRCVTMNKSKHFDFLYPLRELKWTREDCMLTILKEGLPLPIKSSCFFCAASKPWEVAWLCMEHPDLLIRALAMEDNALNGRHGYTAINGLWGHGQSWRGYCEEHKMILPGTYTVIAKREDLMEMVKANKPPMESNLDFCLPAAHHQYEPLQEAA